MPPHEIVSRDEWTARRTALLAEEKALSRARDRVRAARLALPWVKVEKAYVFGTPGGRRTLAELFDGRSQLLVYHFMFGPGWEAGCKSCSFLADQFDGPNRHLAHHDVTLVACSRAELSELAPYKRRLGWRFPWVSSHGSDFNFDFGVSFRPEAGEVDYNYRREKFQIEELPGLSAFYKDEQGTVFHTYSTYARGLDDLITAHAMLDMAPRGRNEQGTMDWVRRHDEYAGANAAADCCA
jgi:predicted dithiol-disulfide oxidoreductase (DUF899 family)